MFIQHFRVVPENAQQHLNIKKKKRPILQFYLKKIRINANQMENYYKFSKKKRLNLNLNFILMMQKIIRYN